MEVLENKAAHLQQKKNDLWKVGTIQRVDLWEKRDMGAWWGRIPDHKQVVRVKERGTWVAQSVKRPTSAQVMIWSMSPNPASGSVLTAQSLEPVSDSVSPSL